MTKSSFFKLSTAEACRFILNEVGYEEVMNMCNLVDTSDIRENPANPLVAVKLFISDDEQFKDFLWYGIKD